MKRKFSLTVVVFTFVLISTILATELDISGKYTGTISTVVNSKFPEKMMRSLTKEQRAQVEASQGRKEIKGVFDLTVEKVKGYSQRKWNFICDSVIAGKKHRNKFTIYESNGKMEIAPKISKTDMGEIGKMLIYLLFSGLIPEKADLAVADSFDYKPCKNIFALMLSFKKVTLKKEKNDGFYTLHSANNMTISEIAGGKDLKNFQTKSLKGNIKLIGSSLVIDDIQLSFSQKTPMQSVTNIVKVKRKQ